ncbi:MAG: BlaI family penicillinase repressor [Gammaproteobacteria bacterium]|jgi:BlaI family penicillinase repressor
MSRTHHLGQLQMAIMRVLWESEEATVAQVHAAQSDRDGEKPRALTTIATMLVKMEKKGVVEHRREGRQFVYRPIVSEEAVTRSMVKDLTSRLFAGNAAALVGHLLSEQGIDAAELERLRGLIAASEEAAQGEDISQ